VVRGFELMRDMCRSKLRFRFAHSSCDFTSRIPMLLVGRRFLRRWNLRISLRSRGSRRLRSRLVIIWYAYPGVKEAAEWIRAGCEKKGRKVVVDVVLQEVSLERMREIRSWDVMGF
jgi:hypothetical protein